MALKDCIKKFKGAIRPADVKRLKELLKSGLSDDEAVRALIVESDEKVISITSRAAKQGATVATLKTAVDDVRSFVGAQEKKLRTRLAEIQKLSSNQSDLSMAMDDINWLEGIFKHWEPGGKAIDIYDDVELDDPDQRDVLPSRYWRPATQRQTGQRHDSGQDPESDIRSIP